MPRASVNRSVQMINLGCAKNTVDAEEMLGSLVESGYGIDPTTANPDVVVINTCGFIESAKQESIDVILDALERKKRGEIQKVVVSGCLSQRYFKELSAEMPEVDAFLGAGQMGSLPGMVDQTFARPAGAPMQISLVPEKPHHRWLDVATRVRSTAPWTAYLKISEGCDHKCTFCAIPSFRGLHASKPLEKIVAEAEMLAADGVKELNLIAQDSTQYGYDIAGKQLLPELLEALSKVDGIHWIRLFYAYPSRVNANVIRAISETPKICQYIDMPLQHSDDDVLRAMRRPANKGRYREIVEQFRAASPDVAIRTTFIVGFPGETAAQFDNLLKFVTETEFDRAGSFEYSTEDGTPSADLPGRVTSRVKRDRRDQLMRLQREISFKRNQAWVGRRLEVLVERIESHADGKELYASRSFRDAPDVDGLVYVEGKELIPGEFVTVEVTEARPYDMVGKVVETDPAALPRGSFGIGTKQSI
ncbi:MAG: 30S ribosomal protein S12 methylthiotransferase RimO [Chthonomonadales bacterium]